MLEAPKYDFYIILLPATPNTQYYCYCYCYYCYNNSNTLDAAIVLLFSVFFWRTKLNLCGCYSYLLQPVSHCSPIMQRRRHFFRSALWERIDPCTRQTLKYGWVYPYRRLLCYLLLLFL